MGTTIAPVFYKTLEKEGFLDSLAQNIKVNLGQDADLLLEHPAIYIHVWRNKYNILNGTYSIYIGETNNIIERTKEHWNAARIPSTKRKIGNWQYHMMEDVDENGKPVIPTVYFFGHKMFHKSLTLDIENRLIDYCYAMSTARVYNGRTNPQGNYSGDDSLDNIFSMIWKILRKDNGDLFLSESQIQKSAIYKVSPNHRLTEEQKAAKQKIIDRVADTVLSNKTGQLIFVEGDAGTGKTVLTSSTFFSILENELLNELTVRSYLVINHSEQRLVYQNISRKLGYSEDIVQIPTTFLKNHSIVNAQKNEFEPDPNNIADIVFVDEAHLLWATNNQAYDKRFKTPQLDEIIRRSRVTVIMYDENQVMHAGQVVAYDYMTNKRMLAKSQGPDPENGESNYIELKCQMRMHCAKDTMQWIDKLSKELTLSRLTLNGAKDSSGYEVVVFDDPAIMQVKIKQKALKRNTQLSRMVATCDWEYKNNSAPPFPKHYWDVQIGDWSIPWHEEIYWRDKYWFLSNREKKKYRALDWAEKDYSVNEVGSTFTVQGFDLSYVGVILGPSVRYDKESNKIFFDETKRYQDYMKGNRILNDGTTENITNMISAHELRVLLTRGVKGLYIYACDEALKEALKESVK